MAMSSQCMRFYPRETNSIRVLASSPRPESVNSLPPGAVAPCRINNVVVTQQTKHLHDSQPIRINMNTRVAQCIGSQNSIQFRRVGSHIEMIHTALGYADGLLIDNCICTSCPVTLGTQNGSVRPSPGERKVRVKNINLRKRPRFKMQTKVTNGRWVFNNTKVEEIGAQLMEVCISQQRWCMGALLDNVFKRFFSTCAKSA